jgi:predicted RecA/RadA family phage recombinase
MTNYVQRGDTLTLTAPYDVVSGAGLLVGKIFGVASTTALSGAVTEADTRGVFDLAKDASVFAIGDPVYWDNTAKKITSVSAGNQQVGNATVAALTGDSTASTFVFPTRTFPPEMEQALAVSLSAAQIIAMGTTPITVIPAPGSGKAIIVDQIVVEMNTTSTQFTGGGVVHFYYHGATVELMGQTLAAAVVTTTAGQAIYILEPVLTSGGSVVTKEVGVDITNATAAFAAGTGTATLFLKYRIITL